MGTDGIGIVWPESFAKGDGDTGYASTAGARNLLTLRNVEAWASGPGATAALAVGVVGTTAQGVTGTTDHRIVQATDSVFRAGSDRQRRSDIRLQNPSRRQPDEGVVALPERELPL